jgi:hypothetical protein
MLLRRGSFMVGDKGNKKVSIQLIASLGPAQAEIEAGVVVKAYQYFQTGDVV